MFFLICFSVSLLMLTLTFFQFTIRPGTKQQVTYIATDTDNLIATCSFTIIGEGLLSINVCVCMCVCMCVCVCVSVCLSLSVSLSVCLSVSLSVYAVCQPPCLRKWVRASECTGPANRGFMQGLTCRCRQDHQFCILSDVPWIRQTPNFIHMFAFLYIVLYLHMFIFYNSSNVSAGRSPKQRKHNVQPWQPGGQQLHIRVSKRVPAVGTSMGGVRVARGMVWPISRLLT